ncbi:FAD binding domain containing protein [Diplocarpon rosae]|nr:FAD binding domain containing protein [Diplocarpon rosae]
MKASFINFLIVAVYNNAAPLLAECFDSFSGRSAASAICCSALSVACPYKTAYPRWTGYNVSMEGFWSLQSTFDTPTCIFKPTSNTEVATAVKILSRLSCRFSIKGGGHTPWAGASSISDGVTLDLTGINATTVNAAKDVASIGAGARFGSIYSTLEAQGLMVAAGRDPDVGIGGLVLGGGYSWFTSTMGFVADGAVNIELVTADGSIINANATSHSDLFQGLKGGGNNFGVVTRYDLKAFAFGQMWGGIRVFSNITQDQQISAFVNFTENARRDTHANMINFCSYSSATKFHSNWNVIDYTLPVDNPSIYAEFNAIPDVVTDTTRFSNLSGLAEELSSSTQRARNILLTVTFANDAAMYKSAVDISNAHLTPFLDTPGLIWSLLFQPIPRIVSEVSVTTGGNVLGLDRNEGNLIMYLLFISWDNASDDEALNAAAYATIDEIKAKSIATGTDNPFIYLNYAGEFQDPLGGYGRSNTAKIAALSAKYDPKGVFQRLVPGGYKIAKAKPTSA